MVQLLVILTLHLLYDLTYLSLFICFYLSHPILMLTPIQLLVIYRLFIKCIIIKGALPCSIIGSCILAVHIIIGVAILTISSRIIIPIILLIITRIPNLPPQPLLPPRPILHQLLLRIIILILCFFLILFPFNQQLCINTQST